MRRPPARLPTEEYGGQLYDHGDPIGFALDDARAWLGAHGWTDVFNFTNEPGHDNGFTRNRFPARPTSITGQTATCSAILSRRLSMNCRRRPACLAALIQPASG